MTKEMVQAGHKLVKKIDGLNLTLRELENLKACFITEYFSIHGIEIPVGLRRELLTKVIAFYTDQRDHVQSELDCL